MRFLAPSFGWLVVGPTPACGGIGIVPHPHPRFGGSRDTPAARKKNSNEQCVKSRLTRHLAVLLLASLLLLFVVENEKNKNKTRCRQVIDAVKRTGKRDYSLKEYLEVSLSSGSSWEA